ncbi:hypothetical protein THAOC_30939 [Thalassiosira oceanica]|uniref:Uncharacterized protein n=1 Tax=Thalassiosira oceanica TaxID=159749 RepID=K0R985_THAOC|nr:hypothetical protein THAOC_30939 [Thalassiosira oceanica]|eukprot:EJK50123.1 hypothetical protein THAOC_30939 [Thalassiosira oceanica]
MMVTATKKAISVLASSTSNPGSTLKKKQICSSSFYHFSRDGCGTRMANLIVHQHSSISISMSQNCLPNFCLQGRRMSIHWWHAATGPTGYGTMLYPNSTLASSRTAWT